MVNRRMVLGCLCAAVLLAGLGQRRLSAQVLADRVPADALVYAGWAGSDALGPAYGGSHLKAFLTALNLPSFIGVRFDQALAGETDPQKIEKAKFTQELLGAAARAPTAVYIGPLDLANPARPVPRIAVFSKVGAAEAQTLAGQLNVAIVASHQPGQPEAGAVAAGEFLLLYVGDANIQDRLGAAAPAGTHALADSDVFKSTFAHLDSPPDKAAATLYFDGQAATEMLAAAVQAGTNVQVRDLYPALADGLGLNSLRQFAWAGSFDGADWQARSFLGMRDRRPGVLALFDNGPLSQESLKLIPKSATSAGAFRFDGMRLLSDITSTAAKLNDQAPKQIESALTTIYVWSGIDVKRELLPAFGDEFVYYGSPDGAGNSLRGFTLVNRLRDPQKGASAVAAVENFLNLLIQQRNPASKMQFQPQALPAPFDKVTAHVMPLDNLAPAWAINDGVFFFSLSLSGLQSAMEMTAGTKPSILENPQFAALRQKLGPRDFESFSFADLERSAPESYELVNHLLTTALARNPDPHAYVLPPLDRVMPALGPALKIRWTDQDGYHTQETGPFPLAGFLSPGSYISLLAAQQIRQARQAPAVRAATQPAGLP